MFKDIFTDFILLRLWSAGGQRRRIPLIGRHEKPVVQELRQLEKRSSAVGFLRVLKESTKLLTRLGFNGAEMRYHIPCQVR